MPLPIPLHGLRDSTSHAGTGFLVESGEKIWLVTCVHIVTGLKRTPKSAQYFYGGSLRAVENGLTICLIENGAQRFSAVEFAGTDSLADVMAIKLTSFEADELVSYGAYNLSTVVTPKVGDIVAATGFPGMGLTAINPSTLQGEITEIVGVSIKISVPSAPGYSGSALLSQSGLIGIVHGDVGEPPNLTNGLALSFEVIGPQLFV